MFDKKAYMKVYTKKWLKDNPDYHKKRYQANRDKILTMAMDWSKKNPDKRKVSKRRCEEKMRDMLTDSYIKHLIQRSSPIFFVDGSLINEELILVKRINIILYRLDRKPNDKKLREQLIQSINNYKEWRRENEQTSRKAG